MRMKDGFRGERCIVLPQAVVKTIEDDPVVSSVFITDIGYYPKARYHYRKRDIPISEYVLIYCVDGKGWYSVAGRRFEVGRDQYFILPPSVAHEYGADMENPWTIYWIHFRGSLAPFYAEGCVAPLDIRPGDSSRINNRIGMFEEIFKTLGSSYAIESIRYAMATFQHYLASMRYLQQYRAAGSRQQDDDVATKVIHFLEENLERGITLKDICAFAGLSQSRLSNVFRQRIGYSPMSYFILLKMKKACELLDDTDMKINQISLKLGFDDPYYFSRQFSSTVGMSPTAFRGMHAKDAPSDSLKF